LREWAHQRGAAGILETREGDTFGLSPEAACVLEDERHPAFGCGPFVSLPATPAVLPQLAEAFGTGIGLPYDAFGPEGAAGIERGISVADVERGACAALIAMAKAYPRSRFHGYDISQHALERARVFVDLPSDQSFGSVLESYQHLDMARAGRVVASGPAQAPWTTTVRASYASDPEPTVYQRPGHHFELACLAALRVVIALLVVRTRQPT
jgi:hypothetical protein